MAAVADGEVVDPATTPAAAKAMELLWERVMQLEREKQVKKW